MGERRGGLQGGRGGGAQGLGRRFDKGLVETWGSRDRVVGLVRWMLTTRGIIKRINVKLLR